MKRIVIAFFVLLLSILLIYNYFYEFSSGLNNSKWAVDSIDNTSLLENTTITLNFIDNKITGNGSVNGYGCSYKLKNTLTFSDCYSNEMASTDPLINEQETKYLSLLTKVKYYRKVENKLILLDNNKREIIILYKIGE